jgi:hypothetical protein
MTEVDETRPERSRAGCGAAAMGLMPREQRGLPSSKRQAGWLWKHRRARAIGSAEGVIISCR